MKKLNVKNFKDDGRFSLFGPQKSVFEQLADSIECFPGIYDVSPSPLCSPIFFRVDNAEHSGLFFLTRCIDRRYFIYGDQWDINLFVSDSGEGGLSSIYFTLHNTGNLSEECMIEQVYALIDNFNYHLNHKNFISGFNIDVSQFNTVEV